MGRPIEFTGTGCEAIDHILTTVEDAARSFHNVNEWQEAGLLDEIESAANDAAKALTAAPQPTREAQGPVLLRIDLRHHFDGIVAGPLERSFDDACHALAVTVADEARSASGARIGVLCDVARLICELADLASGRQFLEIEPTREALVAEVERLKAALDKLCRWYEERSMILRAGGRQAVAEARAALAPRPAAPSSEDA